MIFYILRRLVQISPSWPVLLRQIRIALLPLLLMGLVPYAQSQSITVERRVSASNDDAEERSDGSMYRSSSDLELVDDGSRRQTVGMRFNNVDIPQGATILNSYLQFQVDETNSGSVLVEIRGQNDDNATTFTSSDDNITSRPTTAASVSWAPVPWTSVGTAGLDQRTPDLKDIIQEIVNRTGWAANNSLVIIITGSGERTAESYNGKSSAAPLLHLEYLLSAPPVLASIGPQTLLDGDSTSTGVSASDPDGDPITLSASDLPGFATFTDLGDGTGTFILTLVDVGVYSVTVTASDGALTDVETFDITVLSVSDPPVITEHPADQTVVAGQSATFSVAAVGSSLSSQWQADSLDIVGATDASYTTPPTTPTDDGTRFRAVVTNTNGEVTSDEATLTVRPNSSIVVNEINRPWLYYANGDPFFMCGPGDPEDFLYRGERNPDGTRNGDQMELINKLAGTGANSIYFQIIRSHGGQGNPDHNPFINSDPSLALNQDILDQWEMWFTAMDDAGILIYLTFFDDGANVWGSGDGVPPGESSFLDAMVTRFDHHKFLTWVTAEEYQQAFSATRISDMAALIRASDEFNHPIAVHKLSGLSFSEFADDPNIDQFAIQYSGSASQLHDGMVQAFADAAGRYNLNLSEAASHGSGTEARLKNWAVAMGGAYVMVSGWDIAATSKQDLEDCGRLVRFMERTDFQELTPRDDLAHGGTEYVLAQPPNSYILYASALSGEIGASGLEAGPYTFRWFDASNGNIVEQSDVTVQAGNVTWPRPAGIGTELAVWIQLIPNQDPTASFTAGPTTTGEAPLPVGLDAAASDDPDGTIVSYNWDYGDQTAGSGQTPSHTYSDPGSYTVTLTVTDDRGGTATETTTVTVTGNYSPTASFTAAPTTGEAPLPVDFDATSSYDPEDGTNVSYNWDYGDQTTGSGPTPSHTYTTPGTYPVTLTVTDTDGATATATGTIIVGVVDPIDVRVSAGNDDAEERSDGSMYRSSSDLELVDDGSRRQTVGMRFNGIDIPQGATILNAYLQFQVDETNSGSVSVEIRGQNDDNATTFTSSDGNITSRPTTAASVSWAPPPWTSVGATGSGQRTPDLKDIIQEIVKRTGWAANNSLVIIITGSGERTAESYNGKSSAAPLLHIEYVNSTAPANQPPVASFTANPPSGQAPLTVSLDATTSYDPDGTSLSYYWNYGNGTTGSGQLVTYDYTSAGDYTVVLTVTDIDGSTDSATSTVTVSAPSVPPANQPPVASFTANPSSGEVQLTVSLDATASYDPDGTFLSYYWNYGDGTTGSGLTASHTYTIANTYTVTLTVTDNDGSTDSATSTITVSAPSVPPVDQPPTASIVNPVDSSTVSGTVTITVDASDGEDATGSLTVEVRIDSTGWQTALYNVGSGYYELGWDTTLEFDGNHTIDARATDSGGNPSLLSTVTVDVDQAAPPVPPGPQPIRVAFIGDQGSGSGARDVLEMIKTRADMVMHQGDFDYGGDPDGWDGLITDVLGSDYPYFASVGNHDTGDWSGSGGYQAKLQARLDRIPDASCSGELGVKSACTYKGLFFILSGVGTVSTSGTEAYITDQLAQTNATWRICSWHKNQREMQVGGKSSEVGWGPYRACRQGGAIVATGHEHSYSRTHLMDNFETQSVASTSNTLVIEEGKSFAFVSGLGGRGARDQELSGDWWASIYTSTQGANDGALFCTFFANGDPNRASCYFEDVDGVVPDQFELVSAVTGPADLLPTVSIVSPTDSETVWGTATIQVYASDPEGAILSVQVRVDGGFWESAAYNGVSGYYEVTWNTLGLAGSHTIEARVTDSGGNSVNSSQVTVTVVSQPPPLASFTAVPTNGEAPLTVFFDATASSDPNGSIVSYEWDYDDGSIFGSGAMTSHEYTFPGSYTVTLTVTDNEGATATATTPVIVGVLAPIDVRVSASSDDAEESTSGSVSRSSSDLELVDEGSNLDQTVGMRFNGVGIPQGAAILNAYLQFQVDETDSGSSDLEIRGQDDDNATTFTSSSGNISSRPTTGNVVSWAPPPWTSKGEAGPDQRTPDLSAIIQEIVDRPGWVANNSMVIIITGSGERTAESYNGSSSAAPLLHVEYVSP